jgi:hypothetical protein
LLSKHKNIMKKTILSLFLLLTSFSIFAKDVFEAQNLEKEFTELNAIEHCIEQNPEASLETLKKESPELLQNINLIESPSLVSSNMRSEMPIIGSFWWGCCLGVVGLALVYFMTDKDKGQLRPAVWGCLLSTLIFGGVFGFWNPFGW